MLNDLIDIIKAKKLKKGKVVNSVRVVSSQWTQVSKTTISHSQTGDLLNPRIMVK
jgi:transcription elongation factor GreA-like protein